MHSMESTLGIRTDGGIALPVMRMNLDGDGPLIDKNGQSYLMHPVVFCTVAKDPAFLPYLSEIVGYRVDRVLDAQYEQTFQVAPNDHKRRSVRLDVLINEEHGVIDIELQQEREPHLFKRIRYYQAVLTAMTALDAGTASGYGDIRRVTVVFFCNYMFVTDPLRMVIKNQVYNDYGQLLEEADDGAMSIVYNLACADDPGLSPKMREILQLLRHGESTSGELVSLYKSAMKGEATMAQQDYDKGVVRGRAEGEIAGREKMLLKNVASFLRVNGATSFTELHQIFTDLTRDQYLDLCSDLNLMCIE